MGQFVSAVPHDGGRVGLPTIVEELLVDVVADGFVLYCCGPKAAPYALVTCYDWDHYACVDLVTVRDFDRVVTAWVPTRGAVDIFAPEVVVWAYEGPPQAGAAGVASAGAPGAPGGPHPRVSGAGWHARSSVPATPDGDPAALTRPGRGAGCPTRRGGAHSTLLIAPDATRRRRDTPAPEIAGWPSVEPAAPDVGGSRRPAGHQPTPVREEAHHAQCGVGTGSGPVV
jgi:hypothetical protein